MTQQPYHTTVQKVNPSTLVRLLSLLPWVILGLTVGWMLAVVLT